MGKAPTRAQRADGELADLGDGERENEAVDAVQKKVDGGRERVADLQVALAVDDELVDDQVEEQGGKWHQHSCGGCDAVFFGDVADAGIVPAGANIAEVDWRKGSQVRGTSKLQF